MEIKGGQTETDFGEGRAEVEELEGQYLEDQGGELSIGGADSAGRERGAAAKGKVGEQTGEQGLEDAVVY